MELVLTGKTALITGASRGIGLAMAARFIEAGFKVDAAAIIAGDKPVGRVDMQVNLERQPRADVRCSQ